MQPASVLLSLATVQGSRCWKGWEILIEPVIRSWSKLRHSCSPLNVNIHENGYDVIIRAVVHCTRWRPSVMIASKALLPWMAKKREKTYGWCYWMVLNESNSSSAHLNSIYCMACFLRSQTAHPWTRANVNFDRCSHWALSQYIW